MEVSIINESILRATNVIAVATCINVLVTIIIGTIAIVSLCLTRRQFKATNRPYLVSKHKIIKVHNLDCISIKSEIVNFGNLPAINVKLSWDILIDSVKIASESLADDGVVIAPKEEYLFGETLFKNAIKADISSLQKKIELVNYITYQTVNNIKYSTTEKYKNKSHPNTFVNYSSKCK